MGTFRYIFEDVPYSLVPLVSLGDQFAVNARATDAVVRLACVAHGTNYCERRRMAFFNSEILDTKEFPDQL